MRYFLSIFSKVLFLLALVVAHFFLSYILPFPLNTVNVIFASLVLFMLLSESGTIVWMAFFTHLCIELYSVSPFGVILFSSTVSILFTYWLFQYFLSNRSWYSTVVLTFLSLFFYRAISLILIAFISFVGKGDSLPWSNILALAGWELLFTEIVVIAGYAIIPQLRKNFFRKHRKTL